jgi:hypothetical protein
MLEALLVDHKEWNIYSFAVLRYQKNFFFKLKPINSIHIDTSHKIKKDFLSVAEM